MRFIDRARLGQLEPEIRGSVTAFRFCYYLSDLAVDIAYQKKGVGRELVRSTQTKLHLQCKIILLAAPKAAGYYPKLGFSHFHSAWVYPPYNNDKLA